MVENTKKNKIGLSAIFSCYIAVIPILEYYRSPLGGFNSATFLAMAFLALFFALLILKDRDKRIVFDGRMLPVWLYIVFMTFNIIVCFSLYNYSYNWDNLSSFVRFIVLFFSLLVFGHNYFDFSIAIKFLEKFLVVCAVLIFIQDFLYIFLHVGINMTVPGLLMNASDAVYAGRPGGLYMEPAHYSQSALLYICVYLFSKNSELNLSRKSFILVILGIIASGSGQGYAFLGIIYCIWLVYNLRVKNLSPKKFVGILLSIVGVILLCSILIQIPFVQTAVSRFISEDGTLGGKALQGRTYTNIIFKELNQTEKTFGIGFGFVKSLTDGYVNSLYTHLIQCGYLSLIPLGYIFIYVLTKGQTFARVFIILYAIMVCFAGVATPMGLCFYLLFLLFSKSLSDKDSDKEKL